MLRKLIKSVKIITFFIILISSLHIIQQKWIPYDYEVSNSSMTFYETSKNSIDVLIVGTSTVMVSLSPLRIYERTGIVSHVRGNSAQLPQGTYLDIKEALEYQSPKVIVCSVRSLL